MSKKAMLPRAAPAPDCDVFDVARARGSQQRSSRAHARGVTTARAAVGPTGRGARGGTSSSRNGSTHDAVTSPARHSCAAGGALVDCARVQGRAKERTVDLLDQRASVPRSRGSRDRPVQVRGARVCDYKASGKANKPARICQRRNGSSGGRKSPPFLGM